MTRSPRNRITGNAARILKSRGFAVVWSAPLREGYSAGTLIGRRGAAETLDVNLKYPPNTLADEKEITQFCDGGIRTLRRLMRNNPDPAGEHDEVRVLIPAGDYSVIGVRPDRLIDGRSRTILSLPATRGVPG
jgi:hypothetical protein